MDLVGHPLVAGAGKRAGLFWFTISLLFTDLAPAPEGGATTSLPCYLERPETVLDPIWALPDSHHAPAER